MKTEKSIPQRGRADLRHQPAAPLIGSCETPDSGPAQGEVVGASGRHRLARPTSRTRRVTITEEAE